MQTKVKTPEEIENIRRSGQILAKILTVLEAELVEGMQTIDIDRRAQELLLKEGAQSAFLGYQGFPGVICISVNNEIVHGIPGKRVIQTGDLVGLDFGVLYGGMITDAAITVPVGKTSKQSAKLLAATERALYSAIDICKDGVRVGDIGAVIEEVFATAGVFGIDCLAGHGVGHKVHEDPTIANFGIKGTGQVLRTGMTVALEPIASLATHQAYVADDGWTFMTQDGSLSSQFEHTILITQDGAEILTQI